MPTLHLMVGLPGAGKTTRARRLEQDLPALRLTPDDWHIPLFGHDFDVDRAAHDRRHDAIESLLWDVAARALQLGVNVILDFGFWAKVERDDYRLRAAKLGAGCRIHFVDATPQELLARLSKRNAERPANTFVIPESSLAEWLALFQRPTDDELL